MRATKFIAKFIAWFLVGILALLAIVLIAIQTPVVKRQIVGITETQVNKILNAELSVGELSGNFFTNLALNNIVLLSVEKDTVASIDRIQLNYRLLPLIQGKILVENVEIGNPYVYLAQLPDSSWNVMHLVEPSESEPDTTSSSFGMFVQVNRFALSNGLIRINAFEEQIPDEIRDLNIGLSGVYSTAKQQADLSDFRLKAINPDVELVALNLKAEGDTAVISLHDFLLQTAQNKITAKGEYRFSGEEKSRIELETEPLIVDEFKAFLPDEFDFIAKPILNFDVELENKNLKVAASIKDDEQEVDLKVLSYQLLEYLADSMVTPVVLDMALTLNEIDLRYWLNDPEMNYQIDGVLTVVAEGLNPETMRATIDADFGNVVLYNNPVERLRLQLNHLAGDVDGFIDGKGGFGSLYLVPQAWQVLGDNPRYNLTLATRNLDASAILNNEEYKTDINLNAVVDGSGFDLDRINARAELLLEPSSAMGIRLDTLNTQIAFVRQNVSIHRLLLEVLGINLQANGNYNLQGTSDIKLDAVVDDVQKINEFIGLEDLETSLNLHAHVTGEIDDLNADLQLGVSRTRFQDITADSLNLMVNGQLRGKDISAIADLNVTRFTMNDIRLNDIHLQAETDTKNYKIALQAAGKDMQAQLNSTIQLGDAIRVSLSDLLLGYKTYVWQQAADTAFIRVGATEYEVRNFRLVSDSADVSQSIYVDGKISREASQDFELDIKNLDMRRLLAVLEIDQDIEGYANLNVTLGGEAVSPQLVGVLQVDSTKFAGYAFDTIQSGINLQNNELLVDLNIVPQDFGRLVAEGKLPVGIRLDSMQFDVVPKETDSIYARLLIDKIPLSILRIFIPADEIAGEVNSAINISGVMTQPDIAGNLKINGGKAVLNQYGIKYNLIEAGIEIQPDGISIDTFLIQSHDGAMTAKGEVEFNSELYNADLSSSRLSINFNRFNPLDHKQFNMELTGDVDVTATADSARFSGDITIPEAYVYLPAILNLMGQFSTPDIPKPLLVKELEKMEGDSLTYAFRPDTTAVDTAENKKQLELLNNLQGKVRVRIPRNTWIRNDDMRIELSGDVELIKHRDFFEIFGAIDVVRGQYNLMGKVFVVQSGTVTFQGGENINPILNIQAVYSFRDSYRNKRDLGIDVTGDIDNLVIKFDLDGGELSEGDALSYIIFGRALNELSTSQQSGLDAGEIAGVAASSLISSQVSKFLGNTGLVDYVEVDVGSSFDSGSFTVGKYITNKLFVSYEQRIGTIEDKDVARYEMTLEYEIFKFLFAQLTSSPITNGFDLIFKVNSKVK